MAVSVTEYRRAVKLARWRLYSMIKYWSCHPFNFKVYESYLNTILMAILNLRKQDFEEPLPSDLFGWEKTYSKGIDSFKALTDLYEIKASDEDVEAQEHVEFLKNVLDNINPTTSPTVNFVLNAELDFVIGDAMLDEESKAAALIKRKKLDPNYEKFGDNADFDEWASEFEAKKKEDQLKEEDSCPEEEADPY